MTPEQVLSGQARWCVVAGDNREVLPTLPDKSVAHVITDPPYEAEAHTKQRNTRAVLEGRMTSAALEFAPITEEARNEASCQATRVAAGWVLAFCQIEAVGRWRDALERAGAKWRRGQVWVKPSSCPQFTGDRPGTGHESIATAWAGVGRSTWNGGGRRGVYTVNSETSNDHPTTKPVELMLELVSLFTNPDDVVLDPFCGSGTTGVACLRLGRRFIGVEREPKWAALSVERLQAEDRGLTLRSARAGQTSIFDAIGAP